MKAKLLFLIGFFACQIIFAQNNPGISVQGIARDVDRAAIVDELLTFTFEIRDPAEGVSHYKEDVTIKTDPYGVFSHIIGTGSSPVGKFNEIPFGQAHMSLLIKVNYDNNEVEISNGPFQYTPYAKSAENGVPTGTIVAFAGQEKDIPKGWVLCDGRILTTIPDSGNLVELIGNNVPDLRGMFLRGTGTSPVNGQDGPDLGEMQGDGIKEHLHEKGTLEIPPHTGIHVHAIKFGIDISTSDGDGGSSQRYGNDNSDGSVEVGLGGGGHHHPIIGSTAVTGINETRPVNYGVNYIIKL